MHKNSKNHAIFSLGYHIIWSTKYRKEVLKDGIDIEIKRILSQVCAENDWELKEIEVMPDHVHLFVMADHTVAPVQIAQVLKSTSAIYIFEKYPEVKKRSFWGSGLWSRSTYYGSVGQISAETVTKYIQNQKKI